MGGDSAINCSKHFRNKHRMFKFPSDPVRRMKWDGNCRRDNWISAPFVVVYSVPPDFISKEVFDSHQSYIIPKAELRGKLISVNAAKNKIIGFPIVIQNQKYTRYQLMFNLCFVCDSSLRTVQYEPIVRKLANYLVKLETEDDFLSRSESKAKLPEIMTQIQNGLNQNGQCCIPINESTTIYLKVIRINSEPPQVQDHDVPIFTQNKTPVLPSEWDLTTQQWDLTVMQILPYIDGFKHVAKIAIEADVEVSLVKACIRNMIYYDVVMLIPIFMYSNVYTPTAKLNSLCENAKLKEECINYVAREGCHLPTFRSVFSLYCLLNSITSVKTLCMRENPRAVGVDERKLVQFGLMKGLIRRLHKYPVRLLSDSAIPHKNRSLHKYFTGYYNYDEICCKTGLSYHELEERIEKDPTVSVCLK